MVASGPVARTHSYFGTVVAWQSSSISDMLPGSDELLGQSIPSSDEELVHECKQSGSLNEVICVCANHVLTNIVGKKICTTIPEEISHEITQEISQPISEWCKECCKCGPKVVQNVAKLTLG